MNSNILIEFFLEMQLGFITAKYYTGGHYKIKKIVENHI